MLNNAAIEDPKPTTKQMRKGNVNRGDFAPTVKIQVRNGNVESVDAPQKTSPRGVGGANASGGSVSPRATTAGARLDLSQSGKSAKSHSDPASSSIAAAPAAAVVKISEHREHFLAPGSVEYGIGQGANCRWLTPEDLEDEFGERKAQDMIDEYDMDAVNNSKRELAKAAQATKPPPMPSRLNRGKSKADVEKTTKTSPRAVSPKKESPRQESPRSVSPRAASPRATSPRGGGGADRKALIKEKLATLKSLYEDELIEKEEYDSRKKLLIDEMLK